MFGRMLTICIAFTFSRHAYPHDGNTFAFELRVLVICGPTCDVHIV